MAFREVSSGEIKCKSSEADRQDAADNIRFSS